MNVAKLALENIQRFGEYTYLHYEGQSTTNVAQQAYADIVARTLLGHGVQPGDRVLLVMPNSPDTLAAFQAVWMVGAAVVPVAPQLTAGELQYLIRNAGARLGITVPALAGKVREAGIDRLLVFGTDDFPPRPESSTPGMSPLEREAGDIAMLLYTSGTTALPKGYLYNVAGVSPNEWTRELGIAC